MQSKTKQMISDIAVSALVISFLCFLGWTLYYFTDHKLTFEIIST